MATKKNEKQEKLRAQLTEKVAERRQVRAEKDALDAREKELGVDIVRLMGKLGMDKAESAPGEGYYLQKPVSVLFHEDAIEARLRDVAPKLVSKVFKKTTIFDRAAFTMLIEEGKLDRDEFLLDTALVEEKPQSPRLMPILDNKKGAKK
jgi:hypothetical protein